MLRRRPGVITTMGTLNIVFGSLFLLCFLCDGGQLVVNSTNVNRQRVFRDMNVEILRALKAEVPGYMAYEVTRLLLDLGLAILLLIAGIGLLNMQRWARVASLIYAIGTIFVQIFTLIFQLAFVNPVRSRVVSQMMGFFDLGFSELFTWGTVVSAFVLMVYAVVLLILMLLPTARNALAAGNVRGDYHTDHNDDSAYCYDDEDYRYSPRRRRRDDWEY